MWLGSVGGKERTHPEVGGGEAVGGGDVVGGLGGVGVVSVDVGQQSAHDSRHPRAHVLRR